MSAEPLPGASIELTDVSKSFGSVKAVRDVNLMIEPGEFVTLLGPSGSGKTTTLNVISGFDRPARGRSRSTARTSPACRRTSVGWAWSSSSTRSSRT